MVKLRHAFFLIHGIHSKNWGTNEGLQFQSTDKETTIQEEEEEEAEITISCWRAMIRRVWKDEKLIGRRSITSWNRHKIKDMMTQKEL